MIDDISSIGYDYKSLDMIINHNNILLEIYIIDDILKTASLLVTF